MNLRSETLIPRILWAQRKASVFLTFEVYEIKDEKIELKDNLVTFSGTRGTDGIKFAVSLELFAPIDSELSKVTVGHRDVSLVLAKADAEAPFWPRLLKSTQKMNYIHTDFGKWIDEDEEDEEEQVPDMGNMGNMGNMMGNMGGAGGMGNFGNFDMSQFAGANFGSNEESNFDDEMDGEEEEVAAGSEDQEEQQEEQQEEVKISGLTKDNESFNC